MAEEMKKNSGIKAINKVTFGQRLKSYKNRPLSLVLFILVNLSAIITAGILVSIAAYVLITGIPNLKPELFAWKYTSNNSSMMPAIINTFVITFLSLLFAVPIGIYSAVFLVEYAKKGSRLVSAVRLTAETLSGVPSIVYGLFGFLMFGVALKLGYSVLGGALTLAIMILPLIMRTTEEALKSVPNLYREGSFGLGAGKLRTITKIILPGAVPGILSGVILAVGRIVGETAALIYTAGTVAGIPATNAVLPILGKVKIFDIFHSGRTLSVHMYALMSEGLKTKEASAVAVVILVMVLGINTLSGIIAKKISS